MLFEIHPPGDLHGSHKESLESLLARLQQVTREGQLPLSAVWDLAGESVLRVDADGVVRGCNAAVRRLFGCAEGEIIGRPLGDFLSTATIDDRQTTYGKSPPNARTPLPSPAAMTGKLHDATAQRADGVWLAVEMIVGPDGKDTGEFLALVVDVTPERQSARALRNVMARIQAIQNAADDAIITIDSAGKILEFNRAAEQMFGYEPHQVTGRNVSLLMPPPYSQEHDGYLARYLQTGQSRIINIDRPVSALRSDGTTFPIELTVCEVPLGEGRIFTGFVRDISPRCRAEEELRHTLDALVRSHQENAHTAEQLEKTYRDLQHATHAVRLANQAKSDFLANMSHEIRTPMTAILGYTDVLVDRLRDPECLDAALTIRRNGDHLLQLIDDILDVSKIHAGRLQIDWVECSPVELIQDVMHSMKIRADAKGLDLMVEQRDRLPDRIHSDPFRLRQILFNLIGNAIKFTEIGEIRLVAGVEPAHEGLAKIYFEVIDTGIGIAPEHLAHLFKPFSQADASMARRHGGTGLGLAISLRLTEMLGGTLEVQSTLGVGSKFRATIVARNPQWSGEPSTAESSDAPRSEYSPPTERLARPSDPPDRPSGLEEELPVSSSSERVSSAAKTVPAAVAKPGKANRSSAAADSPARLRCRVLLVEDGPDNQRLISHLLRRAGAEVAIAQNGKQGVEMAMATRPGWGRRWSDPTEPFDVILMDMQMPVMDGYDATRRLRQLDYDGPIIALTAHAMSYDRQKCLDAGCDEYLTKPIDRPRLIDTVARFAAQVRDRSSS